MDYRGNIAEAQSAPAPFNSLAKLLATGLLSGYSPIAPGTAGTLVAAVIYWLAPELRPLAGLTVISLLLFVGVAVSTPAERVWGKDPGQVVIDEVVGFWVAVALLPKTPAVLVGGFFLSRFFDILKPPPARRLEDLPGGWGIMADDVVAGLYANIALRAGLWAMGG